jgi:hypothetical protein
MKEKRTALRVLGLIAAVISLGMASCSVKTPTASDDVGYLESSWVKRYDNLAQLTADASVVAIGTVDRVLDVQQDKMGYKGDQPGGNLYHTLFAFRIETQLKGQPLNEIALWQTGAEGKAQIVDDPLFQIGHKYLLFLRTNNPGIYFDLGPWSRYEVVDQKAYSLNYSVGTKIYEAPPNLDFNGVGLDVLTSTIEKSVHNEP